ncbi:RbsD/FucU family protein [Chthonobacter rhizosphaerae]|uniref:RbsD/FucU family protein n=1 Tax=Chthonobacter rhizosphaerae TaxID=2735553 RepID=UPI0015EF8543|nr:RbsD/FucU domain-containing protein [Chthonobacter rhizosphaerae]
MLKGLSPLLTPDLLRLIATMGHGDDLVVADRNFPAASVAAHTVTGQLVELPMAQNGPVLEAILSLFPLDSFVEKPIHHMQVVGEPDTVLEVHQEAAAIAARAEGRPVALGSIERFAFYEAARQAYAVVQTGETRPYGCFILKKGVIFD